MPDGQERQRAIGGGRAVLRAQIPLDAVSRLFPGLYQHVWRAGGVEAEVRGGARLPGRGGADCRHAAGLYARRVAGILRRAGSPLLHPYRIRRGEHTRPDAGAHQPGAFRGGDGRCHPANGGGGDSGGGAPHTRTARRVARRDATPCRRAVVAAAHHAQATPVTAYPGDADGAGISGATGGFPPLYGR